MENEGSGFFSLTKNTYRIDASTKHYNLTVDMFSRAGFLEEAEQLLKTMPIKADAIIRGVTVCRTYGNTEMVKRAAEKVNEWVMFLWRRMFMLDDEGLTEAQAEFTGTIRPDILAQKLPWARTASNQSQRQSSPSFVLFSRLVAVPLALVRCRLLFSRSPLDSPSFLASSYQTSTFSRPSPSPQNFLLFFLFRHPPSTASADSSVFIIFEAQSTKQQRK
ncbi:Pentatricopeptide repeat-containing protein, mitochondrial, partial [Cucurbita argyrosperma subsp. sororia]